MSDPGWESARAPSPGRVPGRGRVGLPAVAALVAALVVAVAGVRALGPGGEEPSTGQLAVEEVTETPAPPPRRPPPRPVPARGPHEAAGRWTAGRTAPVPARTGTAVAWTGREVLVVGGAFATGSGVSLDAAREGAAYDPAADTWRELAPFPLAPRRAAAAAWTGRELVVWGGVGRAGVLADGAAYDPAADTWRELAPSPLSPRGGAGAVWTGTEVLVLGGGDLAAGLADGAAYDPAADTWRPVPAAPRAPGPPVGGVLAEGSVRLAWTGDRAVVVPPAAPFTDSAAGLLAYAPAAGAWSELPPFGPVVQVLAVGGSGADLSAVVLDYQVGDGLLRRLAPDGAAWTGEPDGPEMRRDPSPAVAGGGRLWLAGAGGTGEAVAVYDLARGTWALTPDRPVVAGEDAGTGPGPFQLEGRHVTWTGDELVLLAGRSPGLLRVHRWRPVLSPDERAGLVPEGTALGLRRWFYETTGGTAPAP